MKSVNRGACLFRIVVRLLRIHKKLPTRRLTPFFLILFFGRWPLSFAQGQNCREAKALSVVLKGKAVPVQKIGDAVIFSAGMKIDVDGAPNAYGPDNKGLDFTENAKSFHKDTKTCHWAGVVAVDGGNPVMQQAGLCKGHYLYGTPVTQETGPYKGYYVSTTSLHLPLSEGNAADPQTYVDATKIPYIALPPAFVKQFGVIPGDLAFVVNQTNGKSAFAIYADSGPSDQIGEGSVALADALKIKNLSPRNGGVSAGIQFMVFPKSGLGQGKLRTLAEINASGTKLLHDWGGSERLNNCDSGVSWQIALQQQRMDAAASGNMDLYNRLLQLHADIFRQHGLRPCESGYYPGGCNSAPSPKNQATQEPLGSCPSFSPRNAQDALQVENSSHKDVCWAYNGRTLVATSPNAPDKANKTYPPLMEVAPAGDSIPQIESSDDSTNTQAGAVGHKGWEKAGEGVRYRAARQGKSNIYLDVMTQNASYFNKRDIGWCAALIHGDVRVATTCPNAMDGIHGSTGWTREAVVISSADRSPRGMDSSTGHVWSMGDATVSRLESMSLMFVRHTSTAEEQLIRLLTVWGQMRVGNIVRHVIRDFLRQMRSYP